MIDPRQIVQAALERSIKNCYDVVVDEVNVTRPAAGFGDYASNVAFKLAKQLNLSPLEVAQALTGEIDDVAIVNATAAAPGFINLTLSDDYWCDFIGGIDADFAQAEGNQREKVQVEYISANPTGPLTLGNARGGFIGDVLSSVLKARGYDVTREYYFNDAGTQIDRLAESYHAHRGGEVKEDTPYKGEYMMEVAANLDPNESDDNDTPLKESLTTYIFEQYIKPSLAAAQIEFDCYSNERIVAVEFDKVREQLEKQGFLEEREGALWLKSSKFGDDRDRVLIKSNGDHTYLANDLAYHYDIFINRSFDRAIKVWGADHAGQAPSLRLTASQLFPDNKVDFLIVQWVRLIKDGQEFKISKRAGTYVTVEELVDRVGADVARWFMLMRSSDTHMDFDLDLAEEQSQKNPYWYVMYAYVRLQSILKQAQERSLVPGQTLKSLSATEHELVVHIAELPTLLELIAQNHEVHRLTFYGQELSRLFHEWYEQERVVEMSPEQAAPKLYLLQQLQIVFAIYLQLIGLTPREHM